MFILATVAVFLILGAYVFNFKPIAMSVKTIYTLGFIALIVYLALGTADDKI